MIGNDDFWLGETVLVTGGTGFMGSLLIEKLLDEGVERIVSISRRWNDSEILKAKLDDSRLVCRNGSITDKEFVDSVFNEFDFSIIIHAAAYKSVPSGEENTIEVKKVNIDGTINLLEAAARNQWYTRFGFISSDKACSPVNAYGKSKAMAESIVSSFAKIDGFIPFSVRYGNVVGSTGAVFDKFCDADVYTVTDPSMTRYWFRPESAAQFVLDSFERAKGGEIFVPQLKSSTMEQLVNAFSRAIPKEIKIVGSRDGEKKHEKMVSEDEVPYTYYHPNVYGDRGVYTIANAPNNGHKIDKEYTSENAERYTDEELDKLIEDYFEFIDR